MTYDPKTLVLSAASLGLLKFPDPIPRRQRRTAEQWRDYWRWWHREWRKNNLAAGLRFDGKPRQRRIRGTRTPEQKRLYDLEWKRRKRGKVCEH